MKTVEDFKNGQLLAIDKPLKWTSFQVVNKLRWHIKKKFELKKIKPLWFDSFYVSLLSEKNKNSSWIIGWPRAFIIGLLSNMSALSNAKRCSSITYIFQKAV